MATNVTEKDKTLNEIIDWAKVAVMKPHFPDSTFAERATETSMTAKLTHSMKF